MDLDKLAPLFRSCISACNTFFFFFSGLATETVSCRGEEQHKVSAMIHNKVEGQVMESSEQQSALGRQLLVLFGSNTVTVQMMEVIHPMQRLCP